MCDDDTDDIPDDEQHVLDEFSGEAELIKDLFDELDELIAETGIDNIDNITAAKNKSFFTEETLELIVKINEELENVFIDEEGVIDCVKVEEWNNKYPSNTITPRDVDEDSTLSISIATESGPFVFES